MSTTYENLSQDVIWNITRNNNAFLVKRKGYGGARFSSDPMNLTNKHSQKYAGYANDKAFGINADSPNTVGMTSKVHSRAHQPSRGSHSSSFSSNTGSRKLYRSVVNSTAKKGYRSDLRSEAVARASAIKASQREKKDRAGPKPRGAKAKAAAEKESS